jgi:trehalose 6-phosphate phosphatase
MNPILSPAGTEAIEEIVRTRALLAFDFDGTLAPLVPHRDEARVRPETRALLRTVSMLQPCAVVSGRSRGDVLHRLSGIPLAAVIGNHGAEAAFGPLDRDAERRVASWLEPLRGALAGAPGIDIEDKRFSIAIHYRGAQSWEDARTRIADAVASIGGARVLPGHAVTNLVPADSPTKGSALHSLCERLRSRAAVYVGDDVTDEDAFQADMVLHAIRVGEARESAAGFFLPDQSAVDDLLRAFVSTRARLDGLGESWEGLVRAMKP